MEDFIDRENSRETLTPTLLFFCVTGVFCSHFIMVLVRLRRIEINRHMRTQHNVLRHACTRTPRTAVRPIIDLAMRFEIHFLLHPAGKVMESGPVPAVIRLASWPTPRQNTPSGSSTSQTCCISSIEIS